MKVKVKLLSLVQLFVTPWIVANQAPPFMEFSRQKYWSGLPFPSPGDLPDPWIEPGSPVLQADALPSEPPGMAVTFCYSSLKGPRPSPHSTPVKKVLCVCVLCVLCSMHVLCMCSLCVFCVYVVCVLCMCSVCGVVQNKTTEFHSSQRWALVGDQTSTVCSFQALCSRSSLIVIRVILSHPFNNFNSCMLGDVVGIEVLIFQAHACGCGPPAGVLGSGDHLM